MIRQGEPMRSTEVIPAQHVQDPRPRQAIPLALMSARFYAVPDVGAVLATADRSQRSQE